MINSKIDNQCHSKLILDETCLLLVESLRYSPFIQVNKNPTQNHIQRFKTLLGPEFTVYLTETGSIFYSALISSKSFIDKAFSDNKSESNKAKTIYSHLLSLSQLIMCFGPSSPNSIEALLKLKMVIEINNETLTGISEVIESALLRLQQLTTNN